MKLFKRLVGMGLAAVIALNSGFSAFAEENEFFITEDAANAAASFAFTGYEFDADNTITVNADLADGEMGDGEVCFTFPFTGAVPELVCGTSDGAECELQGSNAIVTTYLNGKHNFEFRSDDVDYFMDFIVDFPMSVGGVETTSTDLKLAKIEKEVNVWWEKAETVVSADESIATAVIDKDYNSVIVTPVADGKTTVTVTGESGAKCTVNVTVGEDTGSGTTIADYYDVFFTDSSATKAVEDEVYVYVNGGKDKTSGKNYKASTIYTKLENASVDVKGTPKTGKFITYVTLVENETPKVEGGKVVADKTKAAEAKKIVSAKIKTDKNTKISAVTISAGKEAGTAYVWVIDIKADKTAGTMVRIPVSVKAAPKTMLLYKGWTDEGITYDDKGGISAFDTKSAQKTIYIPFGQYYDYRLYSFLNVKGEDFAFADDATYSVTLSDEVKKYISVDYDGETSDGCMWFGIEAKGRNTEKPTSPVKVKLDIVCNETGKKLSLTVNIVDNIDWVTFESEMIIVPNATEDKQSVVFGFNDQTEEFEKTDYAKNGTFYSVDTSVSNHAGWEQIDGFCSTDKIKLYVTSDTEYSNYGDRVTINDYDSSDEFKAEIITKGYTLERVKGKDKFALDKESKSANISAKIGKDGSITVSAKKGTPDGEQAKLLYVVTHQDKTIDVYEAKITVGTVPPEISMRGEDISDDVFVGRDTQFRVAGTYGAEDSELEISSSDESVFTVTYGDDLLPEKANDIRNVNITGVKEGTAKLIVKYSGATREYEITVKAAPVLEVKQQQVTSLGADKVAVGKSVTYKITASGLDGKQDYIYVRQISGWDYAGYDYTDGILTVTGVAGGSAAKFEVEYGFGILTKNIVITVVE